MSRAADRALVTGAGRGLGQALVAGLAATGCQVTATVLNPADAVAGAVRVLVCDQGDPSAVASVGQAMAGQTLDTLIFNAAIRGDTGGLQGFSLTDFQRVMAVNVAGPVMLFRALLPCLRDGAKVAFISSRAGSMAEGADPDGDHVYCASKAALNRIMVKLADDYPDMIFLALHPGWIRTDMGGPEAEVEIANSAAGILARIAAATPDDCGSFQTWKGEPVGW